MVLEEAGLSLKQMKLADLPVGGALVDQILKMALEPREAEISIARITTFDGISLRSFDPTKDIRNRMTIRREGKISLSRSTKFRPLAEETLDAGTKMIGIGSVLQMRKIGQMLLQHGGLITHGGTAKYSAELRSNGRSIGKAVYTVYKYHSLRDLPKSVQNLVPASERAEILKKPALITKALIDVDLSKAPTNKDGLVQVRLGETVDIHNLSRDGGGNVVITAFYDIAVNSLSTAEKARFSEHHNESLSLDLGPFTFETQATSRNSQDNSQK